MHTKQPLRVGIIGCGRIAGLLNDDPLRKGIVSHMAAYRRFPDEVQVVACASRTKEQVAQFADKFDIVGRYTDHREMLRKEKLDIVSICAYADTRCNMIRDAVKAGVRGIFAEKPLATNLSDARAAARLCKRNNVVLTVNHTRRWGHEYHTVKSLIAEKVIGDVRSVTCWFSGALFHTGTHMFDVLDFLFGRPVSVMAQFPSYAGTRWRQITKDKQFEDVDATALITFKHDIVAAVHGTSKDYFGFELDIQGTCGRIRIGNNLFEVYTTGESKYYTGFKDLQRVPQYVPRRYPYDPLVWAVRDLIDAVRESSKRQGTRGKRKRPAVLPLPLSASLNSQVRNLSTGDDACRAIEMASAICESARRRGACVKFPLKTTSICVNAR